MLLGPHLFSIQQTSIAINSKYLCKYIPLGSSILLVCMYLVHPYYY